jgi:hypothetical protein
MPIKCSQRVCSLPAVVYYQWFGQDVVFACKEHADQAQGVAGRLGGSLVLIALPQDPLALAVLRSALNGEETP